MRKKQFNLGALLAWSCGAVFLVPASQLGFEQAFRFGDTLSWCGALAVTLMGSIGAGLARNGRGRFEPFVGAVVAVGGLLLAVGSDSASLWERLRLEHRAPAEVAGASSDVARVRLDSTLSSIASVKESVRHYAERMAVESRTGKGDRWTAATSQHDALVAELASLEARRIADTQTLATAQQEAATAQAGSYWLAEQEWGSWALLGFAALFETLLVLVGFMVVRPSETGQAELEELPVGDLKSVARGILFEGSNGRKAARALSRAETRARAHAR